MVTRARGRTQSTLAALAALVVGGALALAGLGCGGSGGAFERAKFAGDRANSAGLYNEAAGHYRAAAAQAGSARERDEALYLEAATYQRAGERGRAVAAYEALVRASPKGERSDRARFDAAFLRAQAGEARGWAELEAELYAHPSAGSARRALEVLARRADEASPGGGLAWLEGAQKRLGSTELAENVEYLRAHALLQGGRLREARAAFAQTAERHPYPYGALVDDAWWHASLLDEKLGDPRAAVADLERLLASREQPALGQGSYERARYDDAQFRIGTLYRDALGDEAAARRAFRRVYRNFPVSTLRDDAVWAEARLARRAGDRAALCSLAAQLRDTFAESRYAGCSALLCATVAPPPKAIPCRAYLRREWEGPEAAPSAEAAPQRP
ncbi:MAG: tetratricopeptide repeat protein [Polyangiaceae bacterium]|nr:tetratricopeptide repeat protein [Polyangiaceae bacterium]